MTDGVRSLDGRPDLTSTIERVSPALAAELLAASDPPLAVDLRTPPERSEKHLAGSAGVPLNHLEERVRDWPRDRKLLVYCAGGYRSSIGASVLQRLGFSQVQELAGGIAAWETAELPIESPKSEV